MAQGAGKRYGPKYRITGITEDGEQTARTYFRSRRQDGDNGLALAKAGASKIMGRMLAVQRVVIDVQGDDGEWRHVETIER